MSISSWSRAAAKCQICGENFYSEHELREHELREHELREHELREHQKEHTDIWSK